MIRLTRAQVREIDRRSIEEYHIPGVVLMENAARAVADAACTMLLTPEQQIRADPLRRRQQRRRRSRRRPSSAQRRL